MFIPWEHTPNPDARRFELPFALPLREALPVSHETPDPPPIAERLLNLAGVAHCLISPGFVTVTRRDVSVNWSVLTTDVVLSLSESLVIESELAALVDRIEKPEAIDADPDDATAQIQDLLRTKIAPRVALDGGDISLVSFVAGVVTVRLSGACGGCPSAMMTLKRGVEATLMRYVPEVKKVVAEQERRSSGGEPFWKSLLRARGAKFRTG
jgi:NFU1 iron-sulfur cluster scaffold homolog, mitochondrial